MATVGLWLGPTLAVVVAATDTRWLGWFQPKSRRRVALRRIVERLAYEDSQGYDWKYGRYLEYYLGGRQWDEELEKADIPDGNGWYRDERGPTLWWQRLGRRLMGD